jgi:hypothetical protein
MGPEVSLPFSQATPALAINNFSVNQSVGK